MILVIGIVLGLMAGYLRARLHKQSYALPDIQRVDLVLFAFLTQALAFFVPLTGRFASFGWDVFILPISLGILVLFVWFNRRLPGFWLLGVGLLLNFAVITANGGLMPISPETLTTVHGAQTQEVTVGSTIGAKDIVLSVEETRLEWLADRFTLPDQLPIQFAYSLGDVFLVIGAFWTLWTGGAMRHRAKSAKLDFDEQSRGRV